MAESVGGEREGRGGPWQGSGRAGHQLGTGWALAAATDLDVAELMDVLFAVCPLDPLPSISVDAEDLRDPLEAKDDAGEGDAAVESGLVLRDAWGEGWRQG